mmetsp:Transcript_16631/g.24582  ORF Transcript_16631/g.24582 Transcript_16631/m.24582 type:complete len:210 (+) Transcript_16631:162-791(+)
MLKPEPRSRVVGDETKIEHSLHDHLNMITQASMLARDELEQIRQERKEAQLSHQQAYEKATDRISFLRALHEKRKTRQIVILYRKTLTNAYHGDAVPPRYVFDQQVKLLECFHRTEVFRNQWEIISNHFIRITQNMLYEVSFFKELNCRFEKELTFILGDFSKQDALWKVPREVAIFFKNLINQVKRWTETKPMKQQQNITFSPSCIVM